jgi:hypothetical protein
MPGTGAKSAQWLTSIPSLLPSSSSFPTLSHSIQSLLEKASSKLAYLRMVTPKEVFDADASEPSKRYVVHEGRVVYAGPGEGDLGDVRAGIREARGFAGLDGATLRKHEANLRRFRFEDRPAGAAKPPLG